MSTLCSPRGERSFASPLSKRDFLTLAGMVLAYFLAHQLAFFFPGSEKILKVIWPASGIGLAAFLYCPRRFWGALVAALFAAGFTADVLLGHCAWRPSLGYMAGNMTESVGCAWLILRLSGGFSNFNRLREILILIACATAVNAISACIGAATAAFACGASFQESWKSWFLADGLGILLVAPLIMGWVGLRKDEIARLKSREFVGGVAFVVFWSLACMVVFGTLDMGNNDFRFHPYVLLGFLAWPALRFGQRGVMLALLLLFAIAITSPGILSGPSPWEGTDPRLDHRLFGLQIFVGALAIISYLLTAGLEECVRVQRDLSRLNRALQTIIDCNQILIRAEEETELLRAICNHVCEKAGYRMAWVGYAENDGQKTVSPMAWGGFEDGYLAGVKVSWGESPTANGPTGTAIREGRAIYIQNFFADPRMALWREEALERGFCSSIALPLKGENGCAFGAFTLYSGMIDAFSPEEIKLLEELAKNLAFGISVLRSRARQQETEAMLRDRESRFAQLAQHSRTFAWEIDADGLYTYVHPAVEQVLGYGPGELVGKKHFYDLHPEGGREPFKAAGFAVMARKEAFTNLSNPAVTKDGRVIWFFTNGIPQLNADGSLRGYSGSDTDATERKAAEIALQESEARLRTLIDAMPDFICFKDGKGRWQEANDAGLALFNLQRDSYRGKTDAEFAQANPVYAPAYQACIASDEAAWKKGEALRLEETIPTPDGGSLFFDVYKVPLFTETGERKALVVLGRDITEQRKMEEANRTLTVAIDQSAESIVFTDLDGTILYVNQGFEKSSGYTREEALNQNPRILKSGRQDDSFYKEMWDTLVSGKVWNGRFSNRRKDGTLYEEDATISPIRNAEGRVVSYVAVKRDITREVMLERQVVEAQKMEAVGLLAGGLAHDYNNIMAANMLQLGLILDRPDLPPDLREELRVLQAGEERGVTLTRQLLMFSRRQVMQIQPVELGGVVSDELKMLRRLLGENIELTQRFPAQPTWIAADAGMIQQVIMNLCINARDAMPKGGQITISIRAVHLDGRSPLKNLEARQGHFVCFSVADEGCGMDEQTRERIFEPFFTTKEVGKGTGLGLATVYGIIQQHNGWVEVNSAPGKGSEFRIYLPSIPPPPESAAPTVKSHAMHGKETVLVVEDDPAVQKSLVICLRSRGYTVMEAANGKDAFQQWSQKLDGISLLIADMIMPGGMTGMELGEAFQKIKPALPVIILSGYSAEIAQAGMPCRSGWTYLSKPCEMGSLLAAVRKALDERP